jgi:hypothetical protein
MVEGVQNKNDGYIFSLNFKIYRGMICQINC